MGAHGSSIKNLPVSKDVQAYIESGIEKDLFKNRAGSNFHEVINPASGEVMLSVPDSTETEVDRVISNARQQVDSGDWARWSPYQRQSALMRLADLIEKNADFLAELEMVNTGKLRRVARNIEVGASVEYVQYMAGWPTRIGGETLPTSIPAPEGKRWQAHTNREPIGVVGAITPWNFPFMMAIWKIIPALACGNSVVIKPSELAPLTTFKLIELIQEAGIPEGVVGLVTGGAQAGSYLTQNNGIDKLTFTGSTQTGKSIAHAAADRIIPCTLELGGKSPVLVLNDADPEAAAKTIAELVFLHSGQVCVAGTRIYVERGIYEDFADAYSAVVSGMKVGNPEEESTQIGPVQSKAQLERIENYLQESLSEGASLAAGGDPVNSAGFFVNPAVVVGSQQTSRLMREEIFGPVSALFPFDGLDEGIRLANDSDYGLAASIWSNDLSRINYLIPRLKAGTVWVNAHAILDPTMPHGGYKQSGIGREHGSTLIEHYTQLKTVCMLT